jgi:hypothetical protein
VGLLEDRYASVSVFPKREDQGPQHAHPGEFNLASDGAYPITDEGEIAGQACVLPACTEMHAYRLSPKW